MVVLFRLVEVVLHALGHQGLSFGQLGLQQLFLPLDGLDPLGKLLLKRKGRNGYFNI